MECNFFTFSILLLFHGNFPVLSNVVKNANFAFTHTARDIRRDVFGIMTNSLSFTAFRRTWRSRGPGEERTRFYFKRCHDPHREFYFLYHDGPDCCLNIRPVATRKKDLASRDFLNRESLKKDMRGSLAYIHEKYID